MSNVSRLVLISNAPASDAPRQLGRLLRRRILLDVLGAQLDGEKTLPADDLIYSLRLHKKRPSIARAALDYTLKEMRLDGTLPRSLRVVG